MTDRIIQQRFDDCSQALSAAERIAWECRDSGGNDFGTRYVYPALEEAIRAVRALSNVLWDHERRLDQLTAPAPGEPASDAVA